MASRSDAGAWKSRFKACRGRLSEAVEETKEARRAARDVPSLQAEVARLERLKRRLRMRAAENGRSIDEEVRDILRSTLSEAPLPKDLGRGIHARFAALGGGHLELPDRRLMRPPAVFG